MRSPKTLFSKIFFILCLFVCFNYFCHPIKSLANIVLSTYHIDLNNNIKTDLSDAIIALKTIAQLDQITHKQESTSLESTMNQDIDLDDVVMILQIISGYTDYSSQSTIMITIQESSGKSQTLVPITIGCTFKKGEISPEKTLYALPINHAIRQNNDNIPVQINNTDVYDDGSIKRAEVTFILSYIAPNENQTIQLVSSDKPFNDEHITLENVLNSGFSSKIELIQNGRILTASFYQFLLKHTANPIFTGPICSKWEVTGPFIGIDGTTQPINATFQIIAYKGCNRIRVNASIQNEGLPLSGQYNHYYDLTMSVGDVKYIRKNTPLHPFSSWTKVMWWGQRPLITVIDGAYDPFLEKTIVSTMITNTSDRSLENIPLSFGHLFKKGDIKANYILKAGLNEGIEIPAQLDRKAYHADGSLRHGIISLILPAISVNDSQSVTFSLMHTSSNKTDATISLEQLIQTNYDTQISIIIKGKEYQAHAKESLQTNTINTWLNGPIVNEWHVTTPFKTADNIEHPHLTARFYVRAYKGLSWVRTSVVIENNWTYVDNPNNITYDIRIQAGNQIVYQKSGFVHYHHARWRNQFWQDLNTSTIVDKHPIHIVHDISYLLQTKAIPNFDPELIGNIPESHLNDTYTYWQNNNEPMSAGLINNWSYGYEMWPVLKWTGQYLLSMDQRVKQAMIGNAELAGSFPLHFRDKTTQLPVSIDHYPHCTTHWKDHINPETGLSEAPAKCSDESNCDIPHLVDPGRKPAYTFIPYLVTGDYYFLEELHFWANFCLIFDIPSDREFSKGIIKGDAGDMAFSVRTIGQAAYITPEDHPLKSYFKTILLANLNYYHQTYLNDNDYSLGCSTLSNTKTIVLKDDYFTWALGYLVDLGYTSAYPVLSWKTQFPVLRMTSGDDFCWIFASNTHLQVADTTNGERYHSMKQVYDASKSAGLLDDGGFYCNSQELADYLKANGKINNGKIGEMIGKPWSSSQPAMLQPALAAAMDTNINGAIEAWNRYMGRSVIPNYATEGYPNYNIVPRRYQISSEDIDQDGVIDGLDECPNTPLNSSVNHVGCINKDSDNDGIFDLYDACPDSPHNVIVNAIGCYDFVQKDSDHDGIPDNEDQCPDTPDGTVVNQSGCPNNLDSDHDGIPDDQDQCPDTPEGSIVDQFGCPEQTGPKVYEVGPGKKYARIIDCPTYNLQPGDQIHVYYRPDPYKEKFLLHGQGLKDTPIILKGIPDELGNMPIIDGKDAISSDEKTYWNEDRQIIKVGQASELLSDYIIVEGFELRNANNTTAFVDIQGNQKQYLDNACGIRVAYGKHITIRNCNIHDNGNGIQTGTTDNQMILLIEQCYIHNNGVCSWLNSYIHNLYLSGENESEVIVQYCKIGALLSNGQQAKTRAHHFVFRYNWLEGGRNSQLDLVEDTASMDTIESNVYVYGNVIIKPDQAENSSMIHFGGDQPETNRRGTLFFYNNTCIVKDTKTWGTRRIFNVTGERPKIEAYNNIFYMDSPTSYQIITGSTKLSGQNNWISQHITGHDEFLIHSISDESPGFINPQTNDYHLTQISPCIDQGFTPHTLLQQYPLNAQLMMNMNVENRIAINGKIDIGAFEYGLDLPDNDHDGILDDQDQCPETPLGTYINSTGCPASDSDSDGVIDELDLCPDTPSDTHVMMNGCPDTDGDGVIDKLDKCPDTPQFVTIDSDGCPDSDSDGINDLNDQCPDTPINNHVDSMGCPDNDDDGVRDYMDQCPYTLAGNKVDSVGCPVPEAVRIFEVGPGMPYERIIDCPTHTLLPGDEIRVHYKDTPYYEKFLIQGIGTINQPIIIIGIPDASGKKPIIDGKNAMSLSTVACTNDERQVIKIGQENMADYVIIDGFEIRNANNTNTFVNKSDNPQAYNDNASAIRVENGGHITIRNCVIHTNGNGIQTGKDTHNVLIEYCHIYNNGVCNWDNSYIHNMYLSGRNGNTITVQYCYIGELLSQGQQVKSRAEKLIFRYNWVEGGRNAQLDLVEDYEVSDSVAYDAYVYGNTIIKPDQSDNSVMIHFGGDQTTTNRRGTLYFYNNTCIIKDTKTWGTRRVFKISSDKAYIQANNNIIYLATSTSYDLVSGYSNLSGGNNWLSHSILNHSSLTLSITGDSPQFVDAVHDNYYLMPDSPCKDSASIEAIPYGLTPVYQYKPNFDYDERIIKGDPLDMGAFEQGIPEPFLQVSWPNTPWPDRGIYVSKTGTDTESCGNSNSPCLSIKYALSLLSGETKQTIYVQPGTYIENQIYIKSHTRVMGIEGPEQTKIYTTAYNGVFFHGEENAPVVNAEISGFDIYGNYDDDSAGRQSGLIRLYHASNIAITHCLIHDAPFDGDCIKVSGYIENLLLDHLIVYNPAHRPEEKSAPYQENVDIFGSMPRRDGRPPVRNVIIRNSWLFHTDRGGHWLLYGKIDVENMLIENNIFGPSAGIDDSKGAGYGPGGVGIGTHENEAIEGLTCVNSHTVVRNNIFMFIRGDAPLEIIDADDIWVYNNLFYYNSGPMVRSAIMFMDHVYNVGKVNLFNNIFLHNQPRRDSIKASMFRNRNDGLPNPFFKDYNLYYDNISATDISYIDESNSVYPTMAPIKAHLPEPLIPNQVSLKDIDTIKQSFDIMQKNLIKGKGINPFLFDSYPNWMPSVTDVAIDMFMNARGLGENWDIGPFLSGDQPSDHVNYDTDHDGIYDSIDQCPNTFSGMLVDDLGCSVTLPEERIFLSFDTETGNIHDGFSNWEYRSPVQNPIYKMTEVGGFYSKPDSEGFHKAFFPYKNTYNPRILRYGYIDIDTQIPIKGTGCLKFVFTGGVYDNNGILEYHGNEVFYKSQFDEYIASNQNPFATRPLYTDEQFYVKSADSNTRLFEEAQGADRLSLWIYLPKGSHANSPYPIRSIQYYPYIDTSMNDHYYHWLTNIGMGGWTHIVFDAHPQKNNTGLPLDENGNRVPYEYYRVGGHDSPGNAIDYFNRTVSFSIRIKLGDYLYPVPVYLDDFTFYKVNQPENDETIANIGVGYNPNTYEFDIGFCDKYRGDVCHATYEIRYSFRPITNASYSKTRLCTIIQDTTLDFTYTTDIKGQIIKPVTGYNQLWGLLKLEPEDEVKLKPGTTIYFAVKDISNRTYPDRDPYDEEMVEVKDIGQMRRIDLIKTISYEVF